MIFKSPELQSEWEDERLKSDVQSVVYAVDGYCRYHYPEFPLCVTSIFYQKGQFNSQTSVHEEWRGVDVVLRGDNAIKIDAAMKEVVDWINDTFMLSTPGMKVGVYHTTGNGWHIHIQVSKYNGLKIVRRGI